MDVSSYWLKSKKAIGKTPEPRKDFSNNPARCLSDSHNVLEKTLSNGSTLFGGYFAYLADGFLELEV